MPVKPAAKPAPPQGQNPHGCSLCEAGGKVEKRREKEKKESKKERKRERGEKRKKKEEKGQHFGPRSVETLNPYSTAQLQYCTPQLLPCTQQERRK